MKRFFFLLARWSGLSTLFRFSMRRRLKILLYHGVSPLAGDLFNYHGKFITPRAFEKQIAFLANTYTILPLDEAIKRLHEGTLPHYALALTFDDGYRNNYTHAFPILRKYGVPATIFLATDFTFENKPLWVDRLEYALASGSESAKEKRKRDYLLRNALKILSNDERLRRLSEIENERGIALASADADERYAPLVASEISDMAASVIAFGAHTKSHPILSRLPPHEVRPEILESFEIIRARCGSISNLFAYPNGQRGDWTEGVKHILADAGFAGALTTIPGANSTHTPRFELRRYSMDGTDDWALFLATESGIRGFLYHLKARLRSKPTPHAL